MNKQLSFGQLKHMDREELKNCEFLLKQDLNPRYSTEVTEQSKFKRKLLNYAKYLLYNPQAQAVT
jgi:hypothetical protein